MKTIRFSKKNALDALDARALSIKLANDFDSANGTAQLKPHRNFGHEELINRCVEYGRMLAFRQFAEAIEEGFRFEAINFKDQ